MTIGIVGQKCGMTRVFMDDGRAIPVTVIDAQPNRVVTLKDIENDGYSAVQVTTGSKRASKLTKPIMGNFSKAGVDAGRGLWEFRLENNETSDLAVGSEITVALFTEGAKVDVTSHSKGKGFAGVVKRHNFQMQDATHGNSLSHRAPGSIGQCQDPGRVFKGKKMAGHMGNKRCTVQSQEVVRIDKERNLLFVKGTVPGARGADVIIKLAVKERGESSGA
ncbi:MAG: 50S ribosomal protein L3 [Gammaproteobacteria bacterium]|nr:50S ribosomal protein L3 [Gammaproteobacteria bacterium]